MVSQVCGACGGNGRIGEAACPRCGGLGRVRAPLKLVAIKPKWVMVDGRLAVEPLETGSLAVFIMGLLTEHML